MRNYLKGKRIGKLTVIEETDLRKNKSIVWRCRCDCGNEVLVESRKLSSSSVTSCGCEKKILPRNIEGRRFGKLTAIAPTNKRTNTGYVIWKCRCDCGNEVEVSRNSLIQGITHSCGCAKQNNTKHLEGMKFGDVTVMKKIKQNGSYVIWRCKCDCGREFNVQGKNLLNGNITNCGCRGNPLGGLIQLDNLKYPIQGRIPKHTSSGCRGVSYNAKCNRWVARYMHNGHNYYLGSYKNIVDAINARTAKELEIRAGIDEQKSE